MVDETNTSDNNYNKGFQLQLVMETAPVCAKIYHIPDSVLTDEGDVSQYLLIAEFYSTYIVMYPFDSRDYHQNYLSPRFENIKSISIDTSFYYEVPKTIDEAQDVLLGLPSGFSKGFSFGLGLKWEYRFIIETIEEIEGISSVHFSKSDATRVDGDVYIYNLKDYDKLRKKINTITTKHQRYARGDKNFVCYENLLNKIIPEKFPLKPIKVVEGTVSSLISTNQQSVLLTPKDQKSVIQLARDNTVSLAESQPAELLELKATIEHVTLDRLINLYEEKLNQNLTENAWQTFFKENSFILSLAFSYPVLLVKDQASVGGVNIDGTGEKITDFLIANKFTGNLAIFEIKRPSADLLSKDQYRKNLYSNSKELSGSIAQVLDQKFQLQTHFTGRAYSSPDLKDRHPYSIHCVVIIGRNLNDDHEKKSFEFTRHSLRDVQILTYDELLEKLKQLQQLFSAGASKEKSL